MLTRELAAPVTCRFLVLGEQWTSLRRLTVHGMSTHRGRGRANNAGPMRLPAFPQAVLATLQARAQQCGMGRGSAALCGLPYTSIGPLC